MKQRIAKWDNAKFVLILFVVIGHFLDYYETENALFQWGFLWIYSFHIPAFLFLSGLMSQKSLRSNHFSIRRIGAYLVFYLMCNGLDALVRLVLRQPIDLCLWGQDHYSWFMIVLPVFLLITRLFRKLPAGLMIPITIVVGCLAGYSNHIGDVFFLSRILALYPFFLMGFYWNHQTLFAHLQKWYIKLFSLVVVVGSMAVSYLYLDELYFLRPLFTARNCYENIDLPTIWGGVYRLGWYAGALILLLAFLSVMPNIQSFITVWGSRTLQVYVLHRPLLRLLIGIGLGSGLQTLLPVWWEIPYVLTAVALTMVLSIRWLEPPFSVFLNSKKKGK
ncbi:MAG: acyltransferase family protein [Clostridia bacterium]|nr:acyltransferase family protein [Clostridia bacterium]